MDRMEFRQLDQKLEQVLNQNDSGGNLKVKTSSHLTANEEFNPYGNDPVALDTLHMLQAVNKTNPISHGSRDQLAMDSIKVNSMGAELKMNNLN